MDEIVGIIKKDIESDSTSNSIIIIDFKENANNYHSLLSKIVERLNAFAEEIQSEIFNLACLGKWRIWNMKQPVGTEIYVSEDMLRNTGDKNIDLLWELLDKMKYVVEEII